jgi:hypothetical protein
MQPCSFESDMPPLIQKVRHEQTDGAQLAAIAVIDISSGEFAKTLRETGRCRPSKIEKPVEFFTFLGGKKRRERP